MKCEFCSGEAKGSVLRMPMCLSCMLAISLELSKTVKETNRIEDDRKEIAEIEKRYCRKGED
jgi:hypothetical protein